MVTRGMYNTLENPWLTILIQTIKTKYIDTYIQGFRKRIL